MIQRVAPWRRRGRRKAGNIRKAGNKVFPCVPGAPDAEGLAAHYIGQVPDVDRDRTGRLARHAEHGCVMRDTVARRKPRRHLRVYHENRPRFPGCNQRLQTG
jgi:hypothetical protein